MSRLQEIIACPVCYKPTVEIPVQCEACLNYFSQEVEKMPSLIMDLTPSAVLGAVEQETANTKPLRTELFRSPIIPFLYERILPPIWAVGLRNLGGIDTEFRLVTDFFGQSGTIIADISCGTGIMARRLALSRRYKHIIALDYSELMLAQLQQKMKIDGISPSQITIIRADVEALPLASNSIDAIYTGAAMHCWKDALEGIRNIYRVLLPGGKLFATTFLKPFPNIVFRFFSVSELEDIMLASGFKKDNVRVEARGLYATIWCIK
ncbi:class I SAM-dependent methyltransferase [Anabaena azotica]|uniref:Class I SAM-dependent methyltransferase n=1 Tax=Anabaena azotica FACHB-119 TaxID=947527 RepID=A0ABR8CZH3_9NOST|nr:class I SAM-dependent methyltransferase [Anabaena azotica]MBD2500071.1 class I SAM-dependent methyltransferase [Anabaena azotica FACHB-119]